MARSAARSSRVRIGDLAGLPCLMRAPCPHCEQTKICGSDALVAPTCPQFGHTIRVVRSYRRGHLGGKGSALLQQLRQLGDVGGDAPGLLRVRQIARQAVRRGDT